ncbi:MAG: GGDEF domain-containing protein [Candidatus Cloacimonadaceae bacterium]|nr:GGDEF domain-containing protein [Candidatus Cloacimonadaceae bacterium]
MTTGIDPEEFSTVSPDQRKRIKILIGKLFDAGDREREHIIASLVAYISDAGASAVNDQAVREYSGLYIDGLIEILASVKSSHKSQLMDYLSLLNHIPILSPSSWYKSLRNHLFCETDHCPIIFELVDRLQLFYLLARAGDFETAGSVMQELEPQINNDCLKLWLVFQLGKAKVLAKTENHSELMRLWLELILCGYAMEGVEVALYLIIRWIGIINWHTDAHFKKMLLLKLLDAFGNHRNQNSAMVLYQLFTLEDKLVNPSEKMLYTKRLIKHQPLMLSVQQLQILYFFAGNYSSGMQSRFSDSIQYFQYSNYFLHKSWDYQRNASAFLRESLTPEQYVCSIKALEIRTHDLANQISMQNNAYVETLQAEYAKIEELYRRVEQLSVTDSLTGLRNRRYLESNLYHMLLLAARHKVPICYAMIDIDHFKLVNDNYGHQAGDYILKELGNIILSHFRKSDVVVRYGGEEFLVILFDSTLERCFPMMEELRGEVQNHLFMYRALPISITISIGIAFDYNNCASETDIIFHISQADASLYKAKNSGRNKTVVAD